MLPKILSALSLLCLTALAFYDIGKKKMDWKEILFVYVLLSLIYGLGYWTGRA